MLWKKGKRFGEMYTDSQLDVLGFDPRGERFLSNWTTSIIGHDSGVNLSSPAMSGFRHDAYRDRWSWIFSTFSETVGGLAIDTLDA